jgi:hypothetical protein
VQAANGVIHAIDTVLLPEEKNFNINIKKKKSCL